MASFEARPLTSVLGARIAGLPRIDTIDDATLTELMAAVHEHQVVFIDDQDDLDDGQHLAFMLRVGSPYVHPLARVGGRTDPLVEHIVDDADHPPFQDRWHTDVSWDLEPPRIGSLRPIDMPETGGDTLWASGLAAYDALSPRLREQLDGLTAHHDIGSGEAFKTKGGESIFEMAKELLPDTRHPVVGVHPSTGRRYLYVNKQFTRRIVELTEPESDALLGFLVDHIVQPNFCLRHTWRLGELCLWDERSTQHFATADHFPLRREMARVAVGDPS
ncbi:MAG: TauD/TfdA family dioxygenase [Actinomycetota bacterium]